MTVKKKQLLIGSLIIGWSIVGFIMRWDFTENWGCFWLSEGSLIPYRIGWLLVSSTLIASLFTKQPILQYIALGSELILWLFILLMLKGGYAVGFGASPKETIVIYDFFALSLRLYGLMIFVQFPRKMLTAIVLTIFMIYIKITLLPLPVFSLPRIVHDETPTTLYPASLSQQSMICFHSTKAGIQSQKVALHLKSK